MIRTLTGLVLLVLVLVPASVWADDITITFNDLTEAPTVTFSPAGQTRASGSCILETCTVFVAAPEGTDVSGVPSLSPTIGDPGGVTISDEFNVVFLLVDTVTNARVTFTSDGNTPGGLGLCLGGCGLIENGGTQQAGTITWAVVVDGQAITLATDTIQFASDIDQAPAPSSLLLFLLGLPILAAATLGRRWASRSQRSVI